MKIHMAFLFAVFACSAAPYQSTPLPAQVSGELEQLQMEIVRADESLREAVEVSASVDCARACDLASSICALAEKICDIAMRNPRSREAADRCDDARARCARARKRVAAKCRCAG